VNKLEQRIQSLEGRYGLGVMGERATEIIYEARITEAGKLKACGEEWARKPGESDSALKKRALDDLLKSDKRGLMRKVFFHVAKLMRERTCGGYAEEN
jgi:hypothetical protein